MKKLDTNHWDKLEDLQGLLYFAQSVNEMLFDYTLDSYKPLALNSKSLIWECLNTISEVENGFIKKRNLQSVVEELKWSFNRDDAVKELFGEKFDFYINQLKPTELKLGELKNVCTFMQHKLKGQNYLNKLKSILIPLVKDGTKKNKIRRITSSLLTEMINGGYHPNHLYYENNTFFFSPKSYPKVSSGDQIEEFLNKFDFKLNEYTVVFIGGIIFRSFSETLNDHNIVVTKNYNCFSKMEEDKEFAKSRNDDESFVICSDVKAPDHVSARERSENIIGRISNLFNFFHHKEKPRINSRAVISRKSDNYVVVINKPTKSIQKTKGDSSPIAAAESVKEIMKKINLGRNSVYRFARSLDLHSVALEAVAKENQLLDLWAALETLMPKSFESGKDRIVQISDRLIPFLQLNYISKIINELYGDLNNWNPVLLAEVLKEVPNSAGLNDIEKTGKLIAINSNLPLRERLYEKLMDFPLLKNRIYEVHESFKTADNIKSVLDSHKQKVNWHLRRIYRTRGLIIHSGDVPPYTSTLIENLHNYLDVFLFKIIELSTKKEIRTIEQGILEIQLTEQFHYSKLVKHGKEEIDDSNYKVCLFG